MDPLPPRSGDAKSFKRQAEFVTGYARLGPMGLHPSLFYYLKLGLDHFDPQMGGPLPDGRQMTGRRFCRMVSDDIRSISHKREDRNLKRGSIGITPC